MQHQLKVWNGQTFSTYPDQQVFLASPFSPGIEYTTVEAIRYAKLCGQHSIALKEYPYIPHLYLTRFLNDDIEQERMLGINCGLSYLSTSKVVVIYNDLGISDGMKKEMEYAFKSNVPLVYRSLPDFSMTMLRSSQPVLRT